jgi:dihydroneopterin aldolase
LNGFVYYYMSDDELKDYDKLQEAIKRIMPKSYYELKEALKKEILQEFREKGFMEELLNEAKRIIEEKKKNGKDTPR